MLPANVDDLSRILNRFGVVTKGSSTNAVERLKKTCFPKNAVSLESYIQNVDLSPEEKSEAIAIFEAIETSKENGLTGDDLRRAFPDMSDSILENHLMKMVDEFLIVKTGVVTVRFIATVHAKPWILHSFKILRTKVGKVF